MDDAIKWIRTYIKEKNFDKDVAERRRARGRAYAKRRYLQKKIRKEKKAAYMREYFKRSYAKKRHAERMRERNRRRALSH